jgi:hypothetical protein
MAMPIGYLDDWEQRIARQDAFFENAVIDRPVLHITFPKPNPAYPFPPEKNFPSVRDQWFDAEYQADLALARVMNTAWYGDALPVAWPNLGPEVFSAFFGMEMEYGPHTSWGIPCLDDWEKADRIQFSDANPYLKALQAMTDALLKRGRNLFYTGYTDLHPGGDALAAFRDPINLNTDLLLHPDAVRKMLNRVTDVFLWVFDFWHDRLRRADQPCATWAGIVSTKKWHVPSNDFSCMISKAMFRDFFLPGIARECRHVEANIYHLDGPGALPHLDLLLEIPELNAIQWVCGAGNGRATDWIHVYRKCQDAGRGVQIMAAPDEIDTLIETLKPEGVWLHVERVRNQEEADSILGKIAKWR